MSNLGKRLIKAAKEGRELVVVAFSLRETDGEFWVDFKVDGASPQAPLGPFRTRAACKQALDDLLELSNSLGAIDMPPRPQ